MNRIKVFWLALLAVSATSAIAAGAAQAAEFHSEIEKTFIFGEQEGENAFTTEAGKIKCKGASFDSLNAQVGTKVTATDFKTGTITVQPQYTKCTAFGQAATVDNPPSQTGSSCDYRLSQFELTVTGTPLPKPGVIEVDTECEMKVTVPSGNCSVVIPAQPIEPAVAYANTFFEGKSAIRVTWEVKAGLGLYYAVEGAGGSICGTPGTYLNGQYGGFAILRGYKSATHTAAEQVGIAYK